MQSTSYGARHLGAVVVSAWLAVAATASAQTTVTPPKNSFTPAQDVQLGEKAAAQVRQQMPLLKEAAVQAYVRRIGERLVQAIPPQLQHPEFRYTFQVVNASDINAFALPGGPMFVNRGMIAAAKDEGEVAGVMAHELSHVVLRHGTAQATKAQKYQVGEIAGAIIGSIVGGTAGRAISAGTQFGLGTAFLRYSREYEREADIEGTHIMARAGYDPRDMANVFKTIQQQQTSRAPQWMSDHPDPGNRYAYIQREAELLHVAPANHDPGQLASIKADLARLPQAPTTEQIMKRAQANGENDAGSGAPDAEGGVATSGSLEANVAPPSDSYRTYNEGNVFTIAVPSNWRQLQGAGNSVTFAPQGAYGSSNGSSVFTHGVEVGIAPAQAADVQTATSDLVRGLMQGNPRLTIDGDAQPAQFAGRSGLQVRLQNVAEATGAPEVVLLTTALLDNGNLLYSIGVAPAGEFQRYSQALQRVNDSVRLRK